VDAKSIEILQELAGLGRTTTKPGKRSRSWGGVGKEG